MSKSELSRETLLPLLADHVLEHGLAGASLRPLAKAAGTSDRMLIYHFGNKDQLVADLLGFIAKSYSDALDQSFGGQRATSREDCLHRVLAHTRSPEMRPFLALWWEIVAGCSRGQSAHREAAQSIMLSLLEWLTAHMPPGDPDPRRGARHILTLIEGSEMLSAIGLGEVALEGIEAARL